MDPLSWSKNMLMGLTLLVRLVVALLGRLVGWLVHNFPEQGGPRPCLPPPRVAFAQETSTLPLTPALTLVIALDFFTPAFFSFVKTLTHSCTVPVMYELVFV